MQVLLKYGANPNLQLMDDAGVMALHVAAQENLKNVAQILVDFGANVNSEDCYGGTPLDYAIANDTANFLLEKGGKAGKGRRL